MRKERSRRKKKVTNIISFDDDEDGGAEDEEEDVGQGLRKSGARGGSEEALELRGPSPVQNGALEPGMVSWGGEPAHNGAPIDSKSIDNEEEEDDDVYGKSKPEPEEEQGSTEQ